MRRIGIGMLLELRIHFPRLEAFAKRTFQHGPHDPSPLVREDRLGAKPRARRGLRGIKRARSKSGNRGISRMIRSAPAPAAEAI